MSRSGTLTYQALYELKLQRHRRHHLRRHRRRPGAGHQLHRLPRGLRGRPRHQGRDDDRRDRRLGRGGGRRVHRRQDDQAGRRPTSPASPPPPARRWATPAPSSPAARAPPRPRWRPSQAAGVRVGQNPTEAGELMVEIVRRPLRPDAGARGSRAILGAWRRASAVVARRAACVAARRPPGAATSRMRRRSRTSTPCHHHDGRRRPPRRRHPRPPTRPTTPHPPWPAVDRRRQREPSSRRTASCSPCVADQRRWVLRRPGAVRRRGDGHGAAARPAPTWCSTPATAATSPAPSAPPARTEKDVNLAVAEEAAAPARGARRDRWCSPARPTTGSRWPAGPRSPTRLQPAAVRVDPPQRRARRPAATDRAPRPTSRSPRPSRSAPPGSLYEELVGAFDALRRRPGWPTATPGPSTGRAADGSDYYGILHRSAGVPAVLSEAAFISNAAGGGAARRPGVPGRGGQAPSPTPIVRFVTTDDPGSRLRRALPAHAARRPGGGPAAASTRRWLTPHRGRRCRPSTGALERGRGRRWSERGAAGARRRRRAASRLLGLQDAADRHDRWRRCSGRGRGRTCGRGRRRRRRRRRRPTR